MSKTAIQSLTTKDLLAIVRSTNPLGGLWLELSWAKKELARRQNRKYQRLGY
jgi:hypothetical protein